MTRSRVTSLFAASSLIVVAALTGCSSPSAAPAASNADCTPIADVTTAKPGVLTTASVEYAPLFTYKDGKAEGPHGELLQKLADELCLTLDVKLTTTVAAIETIKANRADVSSNGWYLNDERAATFALSDPIHADGVGLVSKEGYSTLDELEGLTVGTTAGVLWTEDLQNALGADKVKVYQTESAAFDDVLAGRIDASLSGQALAAFRIKSENLDLQSKLMEPDDRIQATVNPSVTVALMPKANTALRDAFNTVLAEFRDSGELAASLEEWGGDPRAADVSN